MKPNNNFDKTTDKRQNKPKGNGNKPKGKNSTYHDKNWDKKQNEWQIKQFVKRMVCYQLPVTDAKETIGKSMLGAYINVATDNIDKTLQYIYGKVGVNVKGSKYAKVLSKIADALIKEEEWRRDNPGINKPGKKSQYLLSGEQNEKLRILLFHHFPVLAPILGSITNEEIKKIQKNVDIQKENESLTEETHNDIIKQVKAVLTSANVCDCINILSCLFEAIEKSRNLYSHYRAYNNKENQILMLSNFAKVSVYLTSALKASALICKSNAGKNAKQYDFYTGTYHYKEKTKEYANYYYRIKGKRNIIKANDEIDNSGVDALSDFGLIYLTSIFLSKADTEMMLEKLNVLKNSPFKEEFSMEKAILVSMMSVYRVNIPKGKRMKMEDDNVQLCLDMLNELQKCPQELYDVIIQDGKDSFKRERKVPLRDPKTGEYVHETFVKSEEGQKGQQVRVRTNDGTGNIVYQNTGTYSLLVRKDDRFPYFALRYIDQNNLFPSIRFQIDLGYYRFAFYPKERIDSSKETRILQKRINGFGKLVVTDNARLDKWGSMLQEIEIKEPNQTEDAEIARDEDGNIIELEQLVKAGTDTKPFVTDKRASYNINSNRIGLYWDQANASSQDTENGVHIPELKTKQNDKGQNRSDVKLITPLASLSVYDLPALIFYEYLRNGEGKITSEKIIKDTYKQYTKLFSGIADGTIKSWDDVKKLKLEKNNVPSKLWPYLDRNTVVSQTDRIIANYMGKDVKDGANTYHFNGHIQQRIDYLEREIRKFNDICLKMATAPAEYGTDDYKAFRPASLARKMACSIMEWLPEQSPAKTIVTGVNYGVMTSVLSQFGSSVGRDINAVRAMFINAGIISSSDNASCDHPFLREVIDSCTTHNMENLYIDYIIRELEHVKFLQNSLQSATDKIAFIQTNLPFARLNRKRFADRDENYYQQLAQRYLTIDNSENGGGDSRPAIIQLPDGLFTSYIFRLLQQKYPKLFKGQTSEGANNNASYLISTYFDQVVGDQSQLFFLQSSDKESNKQGAKYRRHYKFFDFYEDPKTRKENYPGLDSGRKKMNKQSYESKLSPKEINDKMKAINANDIKNKVQEYIDLEEAKLESYRDDKEYNRLKLKETQNRKESNWKVYSQSKKKYFHINKADEIVRLTNKLKKLDQMILKSQQKLQRIKDTYKDKFVSLKNECKLNEKIIRRYRIEDIVTFFMIESFMKDIFNDKPEEAKFRLQDVGSKLFTESTATSVAFLDKTIPFSRIITVTFARNEQDMLKSGWEKKSEVEKVTIQCEVFLNRIAIRNYNLALASLNDERLTSFLSHFACLHYLYGADPAKPLRINYNRLSLEFKMYNQLRPEIFTEMHAIEKLIVDRNKAVLNNDKNSHFFIPMKKEDAERVKKGEKIIRADEEAKRNSYVNLLAMVFDVSDENSIEAGYIRNAAAHNHYGLLFEKLTDMKLLTKILRTFEMPDRLPKEAKGFDKEKDLNKKDPHSFAALILRKIKDIRKYVEKELK